MMKNKRKIKIWIKIWIYQCRIKNFGKLIFYEQKNQKLEIASECFIIQADGLGFIDKEFKYSNDYDKNGICYW